MHRRAFWIGIGLLLLAARLCHWNVVWVEEGYPTAAALELLRGKALYRDIWFDKPPLFPMVYLLWGAQTGVVLRLAGAAFAWLAAWSAARAARVFWGERESLWAAALTAFFLTFDTPSAVMALTPDLLTVPLQFAAVALAAAGLPVWAGVCAGVAVLFNAKGLLILAVCLIWQWRRAHWVAAGFAAPVGVALVWMGLQGALPGFWAQVWVWGAGYSRETMFAQPWLEGARRTVNWGGFHAALLAGAGYAAWRERDWRWSVWLAVSLGAVLLGLRFFPRYYFHLLPVMVLLAAHGWASLPKRWALAAVLLLAIPLARFGPRYIAMAQGQAWADLAMYESSAQAARVLRARAGGGDTLLVWGYRPELYGLSGLAAGSRYLDSQPLTGVIADRHLFSARATFPAWAEANRAELLRGPRPAWIADGLGPYNAALDVGRVMPALMDGYVLAAEMPGYRLWRLPLGHGLKERGGQRSIEQMQDR